MTTDAPSDRIILWKGLAILLGIVLLLALVSWSRDRHGLRESREEARARLLEVAGEFEALRAERRAEPAPRAETNAATAAEIAAAAERIAELERELGARDERLGRLAAELDSLKQSAAVAGKNEDPRLGELRAALATVEREGGLARARLARLEEHCAALMKREGKLVAERDELASRLAALATAAPASEKPASKEHEAELAALRAEAEKIRAEREVMRAVTLAAEQKVVDMSRRHAEELAALRASLSAPPTDRAEEAAAIVAGDAMAELRILRARDETRARAIDRLEKEIAALKAALERERARP